MSGPKTSLAAFALLGMLSGSVEAQGVVPGGWSTQFGYQPLGGSSLPTGPGFGATAGSPGFGGYGYNYGYGGYGSYPTVGVQSGFGSPAASRLTTGPQMGDSNANFLGIAPGVPQTSISTDPLMGVISKSVRRSKRH